MCAFRALKGRSDRRDGWSPEVSESNRQRERPRLGISACLLGQAVRYDGGHKLDRLLTDIFSQFVEWVPVCPEVEFGLPVPREPVHLVGDPGKPRLVTVCTGRDLTGQMRDFVRRRVGELGEEGLCGFIFKSRSPSCGMTCVEVQDESGAAREAGVGLFARAFMERFPRLPVEDEVCLHDPRLREDFVERVLCLKPHCDSP